MMKVSPKKGIYYVSLLGYFYTHELDLDEDDMYMIENVEIARVFIEKLDIPMRVISTNLMKDISYSHKNFPKVCRDIKWVYLFLAHPLYRIDPAYNYLAVFDLIIHKCHKAVEIILADKQVDLTKVANRAVVNILNRNKCNLMDWNVIYENNQMLDIIEKSGVYLYPETIKLMKNDPSWIKYKKEKDK